MGDTIPIPIEMECEFTTLSTPPIPGAIRTGHRYACGKKGDLVRVCMAPQRLHRGALAVLMPTYVLEVQEMEFAPTSPTAYRASMTQDVTMCRCAMSVR
jgi:hypothetical protein